MKKAGLSNLAYPTLLLDGSLRFNFSPHLVWRHFLLIFYGLAEKTVERAFSDAAINTHFMKMTGCATLADITADKIRLAK